MHGNKKKAGNAVVSLGLQEQLQREAEELKKDVAASPELERIYVTRELDTRMKNRLQKYRGRMTVISD